MSRSDDFYRDFILPLSEKKSGSEPAGDEPCFINNPLCGDSAAATLVITDGYIKEASLSAGGCAVCRASAAALESELKGLNTEDFNRLYRALDRMLKNEATDQVLPEIIQKFSPISQLPMRTKCVLLAWQAVECALSEN